MNWCETCKKNDETRAHSPKTRTSEAAGLDFQLLIVVFFGSISSQEDTISAYVVCNQ
jgi:hypothetical protein